MSPVDEYMFTCLHILSVGVYKCQHIMLVSSSNHVRVVSEDLLHEEDLGGHRRAHGHHGRGCRRRRRRPWRKLS